MKQLIAFIMFVLISSNSQAESKFEILKKNYISSEQSVSPIDFPTMSQIESSGKHNCTEAATKTPDQLFHTTFISHITVTESSGPLFPEKSQTVIAAPYLLGDYKNLNDFNAFQINVIFQNTKQGLDTILTFDTNEFSKIHWQTLNSGYHFRADKFSYPEKAVFYFRKAKNNTIAYKRLYTDYNNSDLNTESYGYCY